MAGTVKDMSLIKQVLQLKQLGESNRGISKKLPINKETVNSYMSKVESNKWKIDELLQVDDLELERMFHAGSPAYTDVRIQDFLSMLPYIKEQLSDPKNHVTRQVLYDEYKQKFPNGYGKSQFYHHLKQNLVAKKDVVAVLSNTYKQARVVYTRSWVNIYVDNRQVASHLREYGYGFTTIKEHMASNCRIIMERSAAYYIEKTKWISADCHEYVKLIFNPQRTNQPEEIYYKLCDSIISLKRKYELDVFNQTCRQCIEYKVFSYRQFEAILKRNQLYAASEESVNMTAPTPTSHGNMRGKGYFAKTSV